VYELYEYGEAMGGGVCSGVGSGMVPYEAAGESD